MNKVINAIADHAWLGFMALSIAAKGLEPAFPHATAAVDAVSGTAFQLAILCANPMAALKTLVPSTPTIKVS